MTMKLKIAEERDEAFKEGKEEGRLEGRIAQKQEDDEKISRLEAELAHYKSQIFQLQK